MRKVSTLITTLAIVMLIGLCAGFFFENRDLVTAVQNKNENIAKQDSLLKLDAKLSEEKSDIIKSDKATINSLARQIKDLEQKDNPNYTGFTFGNKSISLKDLFSITNRALKENISLRSDSVKMRQQLRLMKERYGLAFKETEDKKFIVPDNTEKSLIANLTEKERKIDEQTTKINDLENRSNVMKIALELIKKHYNITYVESPGKISVPNNRIDTLLIIYPQIKDKIRINKKTGAIYVK
jgi:hypothetical protein